MNCRKCSSKKTRVTVTEKKEHITVRYQRCLDCGEKFKTIERFAQTKRMPFQPNPMQGCNNPHSFLTPENIRWIRGEHEAGLTNAEIAYKLKVDRSMISRIVNKKTYKNIV